MTQWPSRNKYPQREEEEEEHDDRAKSRGKTRANNNQETRGGRRQTTGRVWCGGGGVTACLWQTEQSGQQSTCFLFGPGAGVQSRFGEFPGRSCGPEGERGLVRWALIRGRESLVCEHAVFFFLCSFFLPLSAGIYLLASSVSHSSFSSLCVNCPSRLWDLDVGQNFALGGQPFCSAQIGACLIFPPSCIERCYATKWMLLATLGTLPPCLHE